MPCAAQSGEISRSDLVGILELPHGREWGVTLSARQEALLPAAQALLVELEGRRDARWQAYLDRASGKTPRPGG